MFSENLKMLRRQKGISQEVLAQELNVVRQTVSKWEKGLSVPDAEMLICIADLFGISVSELLGSKIEQKEDINQAAAQLALLNEQLAKRAKVHRQVIGVVIIIICLCVIAAIYPRCNEMWYDFGHNLYNLFNE